MNVVSKEELLLIILSSLALLTVCERQQMWVKMDELLPGGPCSLAFFTARQNEKKALGRGTHTTLLLCCCY